MSKGADRSVSTFLGKCFECEWIPVPIGHRNNLVGRDAASENASRQDPAQSTSRQGKAGADSDPIGDDESNTSASGSGLSFSFSFEELFSSSEHGTIVRSGWSGFCVRWECTCILQSVGP